MTRSSSFPITSTHWGTYRVEAENGEVKAVHGFEHDRTPSLIGTGFVGVLDDDTRIKMPMVRKGWLDNPRGAATKARGADVFVEVSWETAEQLVADELTRVRSDHGNQAIFAGSYGWASAGRFHHAQSQIHRFMNCIGGYTGADNTYSFAAGEVIIPHVLGGNAYGYTRSATPWSSIVAHGELVVAFGGLPLKNSQVSSGGIGSHDQAHNIGLARKAGVEFVNVSPLKSDIAEFAGADWIQARPSSDAALLIAIAYVLADENLCDPAFLASHTVGYDRFHDYLTGKRDGIPKDAEWGGKICVVAPETIRNLARRMAASRTLLTVSWSLTRQDHGEMAYWAAITVAAMLGQIGCEGGGVGFGYCATNSIGSNYETIPAASFPQGKNPLSSTIPVARISDLLMKPGQTYDYNGQTKTYPDIRLVYWAGGNPFHHHQDLNHMIKAWQRPDTVIVNEWSWNTNAKYADIVLPCTVGLEREDIAISKGDPVIVAMAQIVEPAGQARDDFQIFAGIARHMGVEKDFTGGRSAEDWMRWIYDETKTRCAAIDVALPDLEDLRKTGWARAELPDTRVPMLTDFRADPVANPLPTPSGRIELFSEVIDGFDYEDCPGHAAWIEPSEWLGNATPLAPLHLISNQPKTKLHSQLDHGPHSRAEKINGCTPVTMHPSDAAARGISNGDVVRLFNGRGACLGGVIVDNGVMQGVVQMATGSWLDLGVDAKGRGICRNGNVNVLTLDKGTSQLAQGPSAHSCLVEVEKFAEELPEITAYSAPDIIRQGV